MMGGFSQPTACTNTQAFPTDGANCRDSIRDDPKMILGSYVKRAQTISFVEHGFERLGLGHWSMVNHGAYTKVSHARFEESFSSIRSRRLWFLAFFSQPSPQIAYISFYINLYPLSNIHVQVRLSRTDTCPISPYPKWLGVVVKAEKHGSDRCRVFNGNNGSFPFVFCRHTVQGSFVYQHRYFRFFPKTESIPFLPFLSRGPRGGRGQSHPRLHLKVTWTFIICSRLHPTSAQALGLNTKWVGVINSLTPQQPRKILLSDLLVGEEGFRDAKTLLQFVQLCPSLMLVSLHLLRKCARLRDILLDLLTMCSHRFSARSAPLINSLYETIQI